MQSGDAGSEVQFTTTSKKKGDKRPSIYISSRKYPYSYGDALIHRTGRRGDIRISRTARLLAAILIIHFTIWQAGAVIRIRPPAGEEKEDYLARLLGHLTAGAYRKAMAELRRVGLIVKTDNGREEKWSPPEMWGPALPSGAPKRIKKRSTLERDAIQDGSEVAPLWSWLQQEQAANTEAAMNRNAPKALKSNETSSRDAEREEIEKLFLASGVGQLDAAAWSMSNNPSHCRPWIAEFHRQIKAGTVIRNPGGWFHYALAQPAPSAPVAPNGKRGATADELALKPLMVMTTADAFIALRAIDAGERWLTWLDECQRDKADPRTNEHARKVWLQKETGANHGS